MVLWPLDWFGNKTLRWKEENGHGRESHLTRVLEKPKVLVQCHRIQRDFPTSRYTNESLKHQFQTSPKWYWVSWGLRENIMVLCKIEWGLSFFFLGDSFFLLARSPGWLYVPNSWGWKESWNSSVFIEVKRACKNF